MFLKLIITIHLLVCYVNSIYAIPESNIHKYYSFDGVDDYGHIPSIVLPSTKTIEVWVTFSENSNQVYRIATLNNPSSGSLSPFNMLNFECYTGNNVLFGVGSSGASGVHNNGNTIPVNETVHLVWQNLNGGYNAADWSFYINGIYAGQNYRDGTYNPSRTGTGLHIATNYEHTYVHRFFKFSLHQLRVSNIVRYATSFSPQYPLQSDENTLGMWDLTINSGETVIDKSGNGNTMNIYGATFIDNSPLTEAPSAAPTHYVLFHKCPAGSEMHIDKCERCPPKTYNNGSWIKCKHCDGIIDLEQKRCTEVEKHCPAGTGKVKDSKKFCEPCLGNNFNNGDYKYCKTCHHGTVINGHTQCVHNNLRN